MIVVKLMKNVTQIDYIIETNKYQDYDSYLFIPSPLHHPRHLPHYLHLLPPLLPHHHHHHHHLYYYYLFILMLFFNIIKFAFFTII